MALHYFSIITQLIKEAQLFFFLYHPTQPLCVYLSRHHMSNLADHKMQAH